MAQQVKNLPAMQDIKSYPRPPVWGLVPRPQKWSPESRSSLKLTEPLWNWLSPSVTVVKRPLKVTNKLSDSQLSKMPTPASTIYHPDHHLTPTFHQEFSLSWDYYGYYPPKFVGFPWYVGLAHCTHTAHIISVFCPWKFPPFWNTLCLEILFQSMLGLPQHRRHRRHGFKIWLAKIPWRRKWQPILVFLPGEPHGQKSLADFCPWKSQRVGYNWDIKYIHVIFYNFISQFFYFLWKIFYGGGNEGGNKDNGNYFNCHYLHYLHQILKVKWKWSFSVMSNALWTHGL